MAIYLPIENGDFPIVMLVYQRVPRFQTHPHPHHGLCRLGSKGLFASTLAGRPLGKSGGVLSGCGLFLLLTIHLFGVAKAQGGPFYHILIYSTDHGAPASDVGVGAQQGLQRFLEVFAQKYSG